MSGTSSSTNGTSALFSTTTPSASLTGLARRILSSHWATSITSTTLPTTVPGASPSVLPSARRASRPIRSFGYHSSASSISSGSSASPYSTTPLAASDASRSSMPSNLMIQRFLKVRELSTTYSSSPSFVYNTAPGANRYSGSSVKICTVTSPLSPCARPIRQTLSSSSC